MYFILEVITIFLQQYWLFLLNNPFHRRTLYFSFLKLQTPYRLPNWNVKAFDWKPYLFIHITPVVECKYNINCFSSNCLKYVLKSVWNVCRLYIIINAVLTYTDSLTCIVIEKRVIGASWFFYFYKNCAKFQRIRLFTEGKNRNGVTPTMTDDSVCSFIVAGEAGEVDIITIWVRM